MVYTALLLDALGWDSYTGKGEMIGEYFSCSGTGQGNGQRGSLIYVINE